MQLARNVAIVAGGASGLGRAVVERLRQAGCAVAILDCDETAGSRLADESGALFVAMDITSETEIEAALARVETAYGVARICVNCAGIGPSERAVDDDLRPHSIEHFRRIVDINLTGGFALATRFAARLIPASPDGEERGVIVQTASIAAGDGMVGQAGYAASKAGMIGLTLPLAREFAPHAIRMVAIEPGLFATPMFDQHHSQAVQAALGAQVPFPSRLGHPSEFAALVEAIIANPMINGTTLRIDGAVRLAGIDVSRLPAE